MIASRRSFLVGLGAGLVTAPSIVRAASLMPVKLVDWGATDSGWYRSGPGVFEVGDLVRISGAGEEPFFGFVTSKADGGTMFSLKDGSNTFINLLGQDVRRLTVPDHQW